MHRIATADDHIQLTIEAAEDVRRACDRTALHTPNPKRRCQP